METGIIVVVALVVAALAAALGWFIGSRPVAGLRTDLAARDDELAKGRTSHEELEGKFADAVKELGESRIEIATLRANAENFDKQIAAMKEARDELLNQFKATGAEVLSRAQEKFIADAAERLGNAERANKEAVANLLKPVSERLQKYEDQVGALERQRTDAFAKLHQQIETMRLGQEEVRREAQRLGNSLTNAPKARGRWGERALQNLLEQCGLSEHTDFHLEQSLDTDEGRLRPDAIVNVPGQKKLVIDSKVSLNAYQAAFEADDEDDRRRHLELHAKSMRNHVQTLGAKSYQSQFEEAPDYVVMFVPGEHFVAAALEADPELWDFAFDKRVLLATPTNLVAIARTVAQVWRQDSLAREAQEIGRMGAELYGRLETAARHLKRVGGGLDTAVANYNKFVGSFERNVLSSARRMKDKGLEVSKEIEELERVEKSPTYGLEDLAEPAEALLIQGGENEEEKPA